MQSTKRMKAFRLSEEAITILEKISKEKHIDQTALIEEMILTYSPEYNKTAHQVSDEIKEYLDNNYGDIMKKFIARTRTLDVNQQLILDMVNSMAIGLNVNKYQAADKSPAVIYTAALKHLAEKIEEKKQRKDWKETD